MKNYKKKEEYIEYRFSYNNDKKPFVDVGIPLEKVKKLFTNLQEKFGENNEIIKEYSIYKHDDMELTLFPDGSSFCRKVSTKKIEDSNTSNNILVTYKEKTKIPNDNFPCSFVYNSVCDIIDIIYNINNEIQIVLNTSYENNRIYEKLKTIESLGRANRPTKSNKIWCEVYLKINCNSKVEDVYKTIDLIEKFII